MKISHGFLVTLLLATGPALGEYFDFSDGDLGLPSDCPPANPFKGVWKESEASLYETESSGPLTGKVLQSDSGIRSCLKTRDLINVESNYTFQMSVYIPPAANSFPKLQAYLVDKSDLSFLITNFKDSAPRAEWYSIAEQVEKSGATFPNQYYIEIWVYDTVDFVALRWFGISDEILPPPTTETPTTTEESTEPTEETTVDTTTSTEETTESSSNTPGETTEITTDTTPETTDSTATTDTPETTENSEGTTAATTEITTDTTLEITETTEITTLEATDSTATTESTEITTNTSEGTTEITTLETTETTEITTLEATDSTATTESTEVTTNISAEITTQETTENPEVTTEAAEPTESTQKTTDATDGTTDRTTTTTTTPPPPPGNEQNFPELWSVLFGISVGMLIMSLVFLSIFCCSWIIAAKKKNAKNTSSEPYLTPLPRLEVVPEQNYGNYGSRPRRIAAVPASSPWDYGANRNWSRG